MSLKSVNITGRLIKDPVVHDNGQYVVTNLYVIVSGGKKYGDILFRVDCFGPIARKTQKDLVAKDSITVEGTIRKPLQENGEFMNYINADKIHYNWTKKYNEAYKPQQELFKMGETA